MKYLLFLDLSSLETTVQVPDDITGTIQSATLLTWDFEGQPDVLDLARESGFYCQIKFEGALETRTVSHGARPDMFPLPLRSFNDWAPTTMNLPLPVRHQPWLKRFKVSLWGEGEAPQPFVPVPVPGTLRLLLWIELVVA